MKSRNFTDGELADGVLLAFRYMTRTDPYYWKEKTVDEDRLRGHSEAYNEIASVLSGMAAELNSHLPGLEKSVVEQAIVKLRQYADCHHVTRPEA